MHQDRVGPDRSSGRRRRARSAATPGRARPRPTRSGIGGWYGPSSLGRRRRALDVPAAAFSQRRTRWPGSASSPLHAAVRQKCVISFRWAPTKYSATPQRLRRRPPPRPTPGPPTSTAESAPAATTHHAVRILTRPSLPRHHLGLLDHQHLLPRPPRCPPTPPQTRSTTGRAVRVQRWELRPVAGEIR